MGTSQSMPTPTGGKWTEVKREISDFLMGNGNVSPQQIIGSTISAAGGLPLGAQRQRTGQGSGGTGGGGGMSGGRSALSVGSSSVGQAASGLAGFGTALGTRDLNQALNSLGIENLRGRPAGEVISRIAEHLSDGFYGLEQDVLRSAIQQALYNAAELTGDPTYENLEASLQTYLSNNGVDGLIELFLTQYVFDRVWLIIEDYVSKRTDSQSDIANMEVAVEQACRSNVHDEIDHHKTQNSFEQLDWFGADGLRIAETIVSGLEDRLSAQGGS